MSDIHWFPGHMAKADRLIEENIKLCDAVIYVLDARAPLSCLNPEFDGKIVGKPVLYVLNKADLADDASTAYFIDWIRSHRAPCAVTSLVSVKKGSASPIYGYIKNLCKAKLDKYRAKGVRAVVRVMVVGVPNSGKSSIINGICGNARTVTGNKAGVTRGKQWVKVNDVFELLDTPGTLQPKLNDQRAARRLAYIGSIKDEVVDGLWLADSLICDLNAMNTEILASRYGRQVSSLEDVCTARGLLLKGGCCDFERAAAALMTDFRKGRLGRLTLDLKEEEN